MQKCGWLSKTLCWVKEARYKTNTYYMIQFLWNSRNRKTMDRTQNVIASVWSSMEWLAIKADTGDILR